MRKEERYILDICLFYIIYVFLYGIVIKLTISNGLIFQIKTYIPEFVLGLITILSIIKNRFQIKRYMLVLLMYSLIVLIFNICLYGFNQQGLYSMRDVYIPMVAFCFIGTKVSDKATQDFSNKLVIFLNVILF